MISLSATGRADCPRRLAREYGHDDAMARLLVIKEMQQARAQGIDPCKPL